MQKRKVTIEVEIDDEMVTVLKIWNERFLLRILQTSSNHVSRKLTR